MSDFKKHWEGVYTSKTSSELSWTQDTPCVSLKMIEQYCPNKESSIIDIGGGDSQLVDELLSRGYSNITVLDISAAALEKSKNRLGTSADMVRWVVADITEFSPTQSYDFWHDRAVFHFLTHSSDVKKYVNLTHNFVNEAMVVATFSEQGPKKCSGLEVCQYNSVTLSNVFKTKFDMVSSRKSLHTTPFNTQQDFIFCAFIKNN